MRVETPDGISLHVAVEGEGTPVVLLHGFPDSWSLWRHQIPALVAAGCHVIAPDLRGFGASDKPQDVAAYRITTSAADIVAILDALQLERAHIVGHDWGAGLAWVVAGMHPERVDHLVALPLGPPHTPGATGQQRRRAGGMPWRQ